MSYQPQQPPRSRPALPPRKVSLTAAEAFWYVLGCIAMGGMYFAKIPAKKALADFGLVVMTSAERFWYVLMCIGFGAGYFAKVPVAKALSEMQHQAASTFPEYQQPQQPRQAERPRGMDNPPATWQEGR
jgi:hypothetical protein